MTKNAIVEIRNDLSKMEDQFRHLLPPGITPEKFGRVAITAFQQSPKVLECSKQSLFAALLKAAEDHLLPDGRDGAVINFQGKAAWIPMVHGIRKKIRASGEILDLRVECVYTEDEFRYQLGDHPFIEHIPHGGGRNRPITHAYSIAVLKGHYLSRHVMPIQEIIEVRDRYARSKSGPWFDPIAAPEMYKKTVVRHHAKTLPTNAEIERVLQRDHELMDLEPHQPAPATRPVSVTAALDRFASGPAEALGHGVIDDDHEEDTGEHLIIDDDGPTTAVQYIAYATDAINKATDAHQLGVWLQSDEQQLRRFRCEVNKTQAAGLIRLANNRIKQLKGQSNGS